MATFMCLFRGNPVAYRSLSPEQMQQNMKKWMDWKDSLEENGHLKEPGNRLDGTGRVLKGSAKAVSDGPYVEIKDSVQGYMLLETKDLDQAMELSKILPHTEWRWIGRDPSCHFYVAICAEGALYGRRTGIS